MNYYIYLEIEILSLINKLQFQAPPSGGGGYPPVGTGRISTICYWSLGLSSSSLTFNILTRLGTTRLKCSSVSGERSASSVMRTMPVMRTPWFFSDNRDLNMSTYRLQQKWLSGFYKIHLLFYMLPSLFDLASLKIFFTSFPFIWNPIVSINTIFSNINIFISRELLNHLICQF